MKELKNQNFLLIIATIVLFTVFIGNSVFTFWDSSEATYASLAFHVFETGNWLTPAATWAEGESLFPLHIWLTTLSYHAFGVTEFAARFPALLSLLLTFVVFYRLGKVHFGEETTTLATIVLASSLLLPSLGKLGIPDALLLLFETTALLAFYNYIKTGTSKWNLLFWAALAFGMLTKGLPILVLGIGVWSIMFSLKSNRQRLLAMKPWLFLPLALLPVVLWLFLVNQSDANYLPNLISFSSEGTWSSIPGFHLLIIGFAFLPWIGFLPNSIWDTFKNSRNPKSDGLFFAGWLIFGWLVYELLPYKLPITAIAVYPALALLIAQQFLNYQKACERYNDFSIDEHPMLRAKKAGFNKENWIKTTAILGLVSIFALTTILMINSFHYVGPAGIRRTALLSFVFWGTGFLAIIGIYGRNPSVAFYNMVIGGVSFSLFLWLMVLPIVEPAKSVNKRTVTEAIQQADSDVPVIIAVSPEHQMPSLPFYVHQTFKNQQVVEDKATLQQLYQAKEERLFIVDEAYKNMLITPLDSSTIQPIEGYWLNEYKDVKYWVLKK